MRVLYPVFLILSFIGFCQELPPIQNYSPNVYNGGNQNWSISQANDKLIYFANNNGLIEFNGAKWVLYPSPNESILRSVKVIDDRIYSGSYMEFGYWQKNPDGILSYHSITDDLDIELIEDEEFWGIIQFDDWIVFQSLRRIYIYNPTSHEIRLIDSDELITRIFSIRDERILFQRIGKGIFEIINGKDTLLLGSKVLRDDEVIHVFDQNDDLLFLTKNSGLYLHKNGTLEATPSYLDNYQNLEVYSATPLSANRIGIGTIAHGIMILDKDFDVIYKIDQQVGLTNNTILALFEDVNKNLWVGLDNGIANVDLDSPIKVFEDKNGELGSVYTTAIYDDRLYLGTNQGLFSKSLRSPKNKFNFINKTQGQVWNLMVHDNKLFISHHDGTFILENGNIKKLGSVTGTWSTKAIDQKTILQGNYDGLYVLKKANNKWGLPSKIQGFSNSSRYFEIKDNIILVNHEYKGIFTLSVNQDLTMVESSKVDTTLRGANSGLAKFKDKILYQSKEGIFGFNQSTLKFEKDDFLGKLITSENYISGRMPLPKPDELWVFLKKELVRVSSGKLSNAPKLESIPLLSTQRRNVVEFENIISLEEPNSYLIGTSYGYLILNTENDISEDFRVYLSSITSGINNDHSASQRYIDPKEKGIFKSGDNNLRISFHSPEYKKYFTPSYQFQLIGEYDEWSDWTKNSSIFYENLPPGNYTFNVRAKVGNQISSNIASYEFKVSKPWFAKDFMVFIYFLIVVLFSIFMHNVYKVYYKKQQNKIIEQNKKELELEKLKNEKEIIRIKNEQLEKDNKDKNNELAASTMSIIKKNELLTQIKEQLQSIDKDEVTKPVIKIIDKSLNHKENWEMFKEAFEMVDGEFFKHLKERHSNLSPNDLKLCAYLRLNLSSKEVSQLINISPRSVEVKRYRLRKKLDLDNNENLTNYILSI